MIFKVGITGGIGSGKSTICRIFNLLGTPVFEADRAAKALMNSNSEIRNGLINLYGSDIYTSDGNVDRKKLASIIFNDDIQLQKINALVHPQVRAEFLNWAQHQDSPYVVHEAAILFESGFYKMMDATILVSAPEEERINRVSKRDGSDGEQIRSRIQKQWSDEEKRKLATIEIVNDNKNLIIPEIIKIDKQLREDGKIW